MGSSSPAGKRLSQRRSGGPRRTCRHARVGCAAWANPSHVCVDSRIRSGSDNTRDSSHSPQMNEARTFESLHRHCISGSPAALERGVDLTHEQWRMAYIRKNKSS